MPSWESLLCIQPLLLAATAASSPRVHPSLLWEPKVGHMVRSIPGGWQPINRQMFSLLHDVLTRVYCVCQEQAVTKSPGRLAAELGTISGEKWPIMNAEASKSSAIPLGWLGFKSPEGQQWRLWNSSRSASKLKVPRTLTDQGFPPRGLPGWA